MHTTVVVAEVVRQKIVPLAEEALEEAAMDLGLTGILDNLELQTQAAAVVGHIYQVQQAPEVLEL
jgi:hypothetical protein